MSQPAPAIEPADHEAAAALTSSAVAALLKGIKNIGIYRHAQDRYVEFLAPAHASFSEFFQAHGPLPLKLGPYSLEYKRQVVYEDEDNENLTYKFYRDGVRFLIFRPGLPVEELLRFVLLAMENFSESALRQEDLVTRLWKEDLQHIEHVVVEGFGFGDLSEEEVEIEVEKIVGYLRQQLAAKSADITRFARLSAEDLELELTDVEQVRGGIISGRTATDEDRAALQSDLLEEQRGRLFAKMVLIVFQVIEHESEPGDHDMLLETVTQVLDLLLVSEDVRGAVAVLQRFDKILDRPMPEPRTDMVRRIRTALLARMLEQQRLAQVGQYMQLAKDIDRPAVRAYLALAGEDELIPLVDMLSAMERPAAREVLVEVLADVGRDHVEVFARRLDHNSSSVVKDMLAILHLIDPPEKVDLLARCLEHPNVMIRLEGLKALAKDDGPRSLDHLEKALGDSDIQMRLGALRALAFRDPKRASPRLVESMQSADFLGKDSREKTMVATALGETGTEEALHFLESLFSHKGTLFSRVRSAEMKHLAVVGLSAMRSLDAFRILAREVQNRQNPKDVAQACQKAALRLKDYLERARRHAQP